MKFAKFLRTPFLTETLRWLFLRATNFYPEHFKFFGKSAPQNTFLQTSLIIKELIKHENKFNRKVFHDRENSENRFSEFSYFMKGIYHEHFSVVYTMKLSRNMYFMKCSERNISQSMLAFIFDCQGSYFII